MRNRKYCPESFPQGQMCPVHDGTRIDRIDKWTSRDGWNIRHARNAGVQTRLPTVSEKYVPA
jgi:hypothetical protein